MASLPRIFRNALLALAALIGTANLSNAQTVTVNGATSGSVMVAAGYTITVSVSNGGLHTYDWLTVSATTAPEVSYFDWRFLNGTKASPAAPIISNTFTMPAPASPGSYELRYYTFIGSETETWRRMTTSATIVVPQPTPPPATPPVIKINGGTGTVTVTPGIAVSLQITNTIGHAWDWIGLSATTAPELTYLDWWWMTGNKQQPTYGLSSASFYINAPTAYGSYQLRFFTYGPHDGQTWTLRATSATLVVAPPPPPPTPAIAINGGQSAVQVLPGAALGLQLTNGVGHVSDWIGVSVVTAPELSYLDWWFMTGTRQEPPTPITSASFGITAPLFPGNYQLRYFTYGPHDGQMWSLRATSATIAVVPPTNCEYTVAAPSGAAPLEGVSRTVSIVSNQAGCVWTASSPVSWVTFNATAGLGNSVTFTVASAVNSAPRSATITVAGQPISVSQGGLPVELIINGDFEGGFYNANPAYGTGLVGNYWSNGANSNTQTFLSVGGVPGDYEQEIEYGGNHDGIQQSMSLPPNRLHVLTADVFVLSGTARLTAHVWGAPDVEQVVSARLGAQRLRLVFSQNVHPYGPLNVTASIVTGQDGSHIRVDHVSLRGLDVAIPEHVLNSNFERPFYTFGDANGSGVIAESFTHLGQSTPPQGVFGTVGPSNNFAQSIEGGGAGTGLKQVVTLQANQRYLLQADVQMLSGGAKLVIGPTGGVETEQIYLCGGTTTWHELATLFTPQFTGQYTVAVKSLFAQSNYNVDDISITPTGRIFVQPSTAGNGTPCIQKHTVTFEVHDGATQDPIEGATVEIAPNYGSGPSRVTYPDGTISYMVGEGSLQFSVFADGYTPQTSIITVTGGSTQSIALTQGAQPDPLPGGAPPEGVTPGGGTIRLAQAPTVIARIALDGTPVYQLAPEVVVETESDGTPVYEIPSTDDDRWFPEWGFLDSQGIHWASGPDKNQVGSCLGNCGLGCTSNVLPFGRLSCGTRDFWSRETLAAPSYQSVEGRVECIDREDYAVEYDVFVMPVRWTYHGNISTACYAHDLILRDRPWLWTLPGIPLGIISAPMAAITSCIGAQPNDWSYETLQFGRKFRSATRGSYPEGSGACRVP